MKDEQFASKNKAEVRDNSEMQIANPENKLDFSQIEKKWQDKWEKAKLFQATEEPNKKKFYVLEMFPYPSAAGLHIGHAFNFVIGDIYSRFKKMQGFNVLHPMGFDSLGLPAENAAIKAKTHPEDYTNNSIKNFIKQQQTLGLTYDWTRMVNTADPNYYKWDQWIFLKMFEKGLIYQKKAAVNWCSKCDTILANEQVVDGCCWRHEDTEVEVKQMNQWFIKITDYADRLLEGHKNLRWPEKTIAMQKNWIGKSFGTEIDFEINKNKWPIFTTRPDTIFGVTFMVVSAQHARLNELVTKEQKFDVEKFLKKLKSVSEKDLGEMEKEGVFTGSYAINPSTGDKVPVYAGNFVVADYGAGMVMAVPAHDQRDFEFAKKYQIPIKEVIMPVFGEKHEGEEFRKTISAVVRRKKDNKFLFMKWKEFGWVSPVVGGIENDEDLSRAAEREVLEETGFKVKFVRKLGGETEEHFFAENKNVWRNRLDQPVLMELISEKREKVSEEESERHEAIWLDAEEALEKVTHKYNNIGLLRYLEKDEAYTESGKLINSKEFDGISNEEAIGKISDWLISKNLARKVVNYKLRDWSVARQRYWGTPIPLIHCEKCEVVPVPEKDLPVELPKEVKFGKGNPLLTNEKWLNVKCPKCGGKARREANTMDTFVNSSWYFFRYCDPKNKTEIFAKEKAKYWMPVDLYIGGAEHACMHLIYCRFYTMFLHDIGLIDFEEPTPRLFHQGMINDEKGEKMSKSKGNVIEPLETMAKYGVDTTRFFLMSEASPDKGFNWSDAGIQGSLRIVNKIWSISEKIRFGKDSEELTTKINRSIKLITEQIETIDYRKSTIELRELFDLISKQSEISKESFGKALRLLAPFCPHIAEELWEKIGNKNFISAAEWPKYEEKKESKKQEDISEKIIGNIKHIVDKIAETEKINKIYMYLMPFEIKSVNKDKFQKAFGKPVEIFAVNDPNKYDPENRSKKSLPGKPGIFVE